jgi:hypothetical protein
MALLICLKCTTAYSVGAPCCPNCGGKKSVEQGSKGDPTLAAEPAVSVGSAVPGGEAPDA